MSSPRECPNKSNENSVILEFNINKFVRATYFELSLLKYLFSEQTLISNFFAFWKEAILSYFSALFHNILFLKMMNFYVYI